MKQSQNYLFTILSNLSYLPPIIYLINARMYANALNLCFVFVFSLLYHICDYGNCVAPFTILETLDWYFSFSAVFLIGAYFIDMRSHRIKLALYVLIPSYVMLFLVFDTTHQYSFYAMSSIFVFLAIIHLIINILRNFNIAKRLKLPPFIINLIGSRKHTIHLMRAIFFIIGICLFIPAVVFLYDTSIYWLYHGLWHMLSGLCQIPLYSLYDHKTLISKILFIKNQKIISSSAIPSKYQQSS